MAQTLSMAIAKAALKLMEEGYAEDAAIAIATIETRERFAKRKPK